jgi:hypothetical protein
MVTLITDHLVAMNPNAIHIMNYNDDGLELYQIMKFADDESVFISGLRQYQVDIIYSILQLHVFVSHRL